jgi:hypothetical protein
LKKHRVIDYALLITWTTFISLLDYFPGHITYGPVRRGSFDLFITRSVHEFAEAITEDELKGRRGLSLFCDGEH